ncbi:MAG TPA: glucosidase [Candidatus Binatia bacterium]
MTAEQQRLDEARSGVAWRRWGPYLSERQWGTVREDYSETGAAWDSFTHDQARSRTYRWGEDGLLGISDDKQRLCFALALWNGRDGILKERLFGLTNSEGNHGEDVKEYYFYLDSTPTHSYMKALYKYPQRAFPYADLVETNRARTRRELEYELIDTGVLDDDRYFDVFVEYAKAAPDDVAIRITVANRGPEDARLHVLPTLWFRNTWRRPHGGAKPSLRARDGSSSEPAIVASHDVLGTYVLSCDDASATLLFTDNESNEERLSGQPNASPFVKDAFHRWLVDGEAGAVNPERTGTKSAAHVAYVVPARGERVLRLRLRADGSHEPAFGAGFDALFEQRKAEADAFYDVLTPPAADAEERMIARQALAGMLWSKQYYFFDLDVWLDEHRSHPLRHKEAGSVRNREWFHMLNDDVISMPDKWEYPWYAAWDLAFHCLALAIVDIDFAKQQLDLMLNELYLHPSGQLPAYEWNFGDVNPPVHGWATIHVYRSELMRTGRADRAWLERAFHKLLVNFTWWVNRKDPRGKNVFEGGFLGLDNIGVFDRSKPLPTGGSLEQADGTAWMVLYSHNMLEIALELAAEDPAYEELALKFVEHALSIAAAMDRIGEAHDAMWDEEDGFFYDVLRLPDGSAQRLKVRSLVGLLPLCATTTIWATDVRERFPRLFRGVQRYLERYPELLHNIMPPTEVGVGGRRLLGVLQESKLRRVLAHMLDEGEFLSPFGIRSISRHHLEHPFVFVVHGEEHRVEYQPAESTSGLFGGNSNWRGPVWFPTNLLIIRALLTMYAYYGDDFTVECPTGSGRRMTLYGVAEEIARRLITIFRRGADGRRPVYGDTTKFQTDPHFRDLLLFYEYFHGDNGAGIGASHQTGWTGNVAGLIQLFRHLTPQAVLGSHERPSVFYVPPSEGAR